MRFKTPLITVTLAVTALAAPSAGIAAKKKPRPVVRTLTGQVVGSTLPSGTRVGVPVLLDAPSMRRAKLRGPLALIKVPRTALVRVPGNQRIGLASLRAGDVFRARLAVPAAARRASFPAMKVNASAFTLTRRGTSLSPGELQAQIAALGGYVGALAGYVIVEFADLRGQVTSLRAQLGGLDRAVSDLRARLDALPPGSLEQITTLITRVTQLETQLTSITNQLTTLTGDVTTLTSKLQGISPGELADALTDIAALQALVGGVNVPALSSSLTALTSSVGTANASLQGQIDTAETALATAERQIEYLCSSQLVTGPIPGVSLLGSCPS